MPRKRNESQKRLGLFTMVHRDRWHDRSYTELPWDEKAMLGMIETFDGITAAGVVRAEPEILSQKHPDRDAAQIDAYLTSLHAKGWISRAGSEVFVKNWFINQPSQLKSDLNLKSIYSAINRIGYEELRTAVVENLFATILDIERVDKSQTTAAVKHVCQDIAEQHGVVLPSKLAKGRAA